MQMGKCRARRPWSFLCCLALTTGLAQADTNPTGDTPGSLTAQAGNPNAPLAQLQITYLYSAVVQNSADEAEQFLFEPVIPVPANKFGPLAQIIRPTASYLNVPDGRSGFGDLDLQHVFVPEKFSWGTIG